MLFILIQLRPAFSLVAQIISTVCSVLKYLSRLIALHQFNPYLGSDALYWHPEFRTPNPLRIRMKVEYEFQFQNTYSNGDPTSCEYLEFEHDQIRAMIRTDG